MFTLRYRHFTFKQELINLRYEYILQSIIVFSKKRLLRVSAHSRQAWYWAKVVRISFMYLTFVTVGFGFALYLFMAFWMRIKDLIYTKRSSVFDL